MTPRGIGLRTFLTKCASTDMRRTIVRVRSSAGATLGDIYTTLSKRGAAFVGGTCPFVGIGGHVLGGGYGLLARSFGLACDNLKSITLVDAQFRTLNVSATPRALLGVQRGRRRFLRDRDGVRILDACGNKCGDLRCGLDLSKRPGPAGHQGVAATGGKWAVNDDGQSA